MHKSRYILWSVLVFIFQASSAQSSFDSLFDKAYQLEGENREEAIKLYVHIDSLAKLSGDLLSRAKTFHYRGIVLSEAASYGESVSSYKQAIEWYEELNNISGAAACRQNLGNIYTAQGDFKTALEYFHQSVTELENIRDSNRLIISYNNIGGAYRSLMEYDDAVVFHNKALTISIALRDTTGIANAISNLGTVYSSQGQHKLAKKNFRKAMVYAKILGNTYLQLIIYNNLGSLYYDDELYDSAYWYGNKSLELAIKLNQPYDLSDIYTTTGYYATAAGKLKVAKDYLYKGKELAEAYNFLDLKQKAYYRLSNFLFETQDYKNSYLYLDESLALKDSLYTSDLRMELGKLSARYEIESEQRETALKEQEEAKLRASILDRQKTLQYSFIFLFLTVLFLISSTSKYIHLSQRTRSVVILVFLMILFEFVLVLSDPWVDKVAGNLPIYKLASNVLLAAVILPLHSVMKRLLDR
jgi:tetratricopeptide (TPR) repeat protein